MDTGPISDLKQVNLQRRGPNQNTTMVNKPTTACVTTTDVDQLAQNVQPWDVKFTQLALGKFHGLCEVVELDGLIIYRERWTHRVLATGAPPPGYVMLGYAENVSWCGKLLEPECLASATAGSELGFTTPDHSDHAIVLIPERNFNRSLGNTAVGTLVAGTRFRQQFTNWVRRCVAHPQLLSNPHNARAFESRLLQLFEQRPDPTSTFGDRPGGSVNWKTVLDALEILDASDHPVFSMSELAAAVCVSQRTLEHAFKCALGVTPIRFDRFRRLMAAHRQLRDADPDSPLTVADIAGRNGFTEFGRFSVQYREFFSQKPSETLKTHGTAPNPRLIDVFTRRPRWYPAATNF